MTTGLDRITSRAKAEPKVRITAMAHHITEDFLRETWQALNQQGAAGVDQVSMKVYGEELEANVAKLVTNLKAHRYRPPMV